MNERRLPFLVVQSYGLATMFFNMMMSVAIYYYSYFMTDVALILPAHLSIFMFITHTVDAIAVPVSGAIIQKTQFRWGQYRSWLLFLPFSTFVFFTLTFTNIPSIGYWTKLCYLGAAYLISHISLNFAFNAQLGLISVLSGNVDDRATLSARNVQYQYGSLIIFSVVGIRLLNYLNKGYGESVGFFIIVIFLAALQVLGYWNLFFRTKEYDRYDPNKKLKPAYNLTGIEMLMQVIGNRHLVIIMIADTLKDIAIFSLTSVAAYYFKYVTEDSSWMAYYPLLTTFAILISTLIAPYITRMVGKKEICLYTAFIGTIGYLILWKYGARSPVEYISIICITNLVVYLPMPIRQAMYMDAAEYGFYKTGKNASAFIMSMYTMPVKIGMDIAITLIPAFLAYIGFQANMEATPEFISSLMNLIAFLPLGCYLLAGIVFIFYGLTDEKVAFYMEANQKKRAETEV
ncbi:MAG: MFS transporter [Deltaproteobacteria bacterium]|nr:MFS transporter [Deltaproteobacteria bacterium]